MFPIKIMLAVMLMLFSPPAKAQDFVIIVASYHQEDPCEKLQYAGVISALKSSMSQELKICSYYLDSKRLSMDEVNKKINEVLSAIDKEKPKVIIALDDLAFSVIAPKVIDYEDTFLVFSGINRSLEEYNAKLHFLQGDKPIKNITGVYECLFMQKQMELLDLILERPSKVALIYSTDYIGQIAKSQVLRELDNSEYKDRVELFPVTTMKELEAAIQTIASRPDIQAYIPLILSVSPKHPTKKHYKQTIEGIAPLLTSKIKKIDLTPNKLFTELGFFGGYSVDFFQMGHQAGLLGVRLLESHPISSLLIEKAKNYKIIVNKKRIKELGIRLNDEILNLVDKFIQ